MRRQKQRKMAKECEGEKYHPRVKVKKGFSVKKGVLGFYSMARDLSQQHKELVSKAIADVGRRMESIFFPHIEDFYIALGRKELYMNF